VNKIFFNGTPENFLSKEGISKIFSALHKWSVEFLTVFGSTCCCWRGELSPPASYSKYKIWVILQF